MRMAGLSRARSDPAGRARVPARAAATALAAVCALVGVLVAAGSAGAAVPYTAYVGSFTSGSLTPINTATNATSSSIATNDPSALAITPDAKSAWIVNREEGTVTPVTLSTGTVGSAIAVGIKPCAIAITPDGKTAYVVNFGSNNVTPVNLASGTAGAAIAVGSGPYSIAITPDGTKAYVTNSGSETVTPINLANNTPGAPIAVGNKPSGLAITPDGKTAYVSNEGSNTVTPITLATNGVGTAIAVGNAPIAIAITPDGTKAYVADHASANVTPITLATNTAGTPIAVDLEPASVAITPDQATAYVANEGAGATVTPINLSNNTAGAAIALGKRSNAVAITPDQAPVASFTVTPGVSGSPSFFDASASSVTYGSITGYHWSFGDGESVETATPRTNHTYAAAGNYTVTLTETDSAGTSTSTVFTGLTMSRNGGTVAQSSRVVTIVPPPPVNTVLPAINGTAQQGHTLIEHNGSWTNVPTGYMYQWLRCDGRGENCAAISAATSQTYVPVAADVGRTLRVQEAASNAGGAGSPAESPATGLVEAASTITPVSSATSVVISTGSVTITAHGEVLITVSCPRSALGGCRGTITLRLAEPRPRRARAHAARCTRGCRSLGSAKYEAGAGRTIHVRVHMASFGRRLLAQHRALRVTVTATSISEGGSTTISRTITLRARTRVS